MAEDSTIVDAIKANAAGPRKASNETTSAEMHPLKDQIDAARFVASSAAVTGKRLGIRLGKFTTPGAAEH